MRTPSEFPLALALTSFILDNNFALREFTRPKRRTNTTRGGRGARHPKTTLPHRPPGTPAAVVLFGGRPQAPARFGVKNAPRRFFTRPPPCRSWCLRHALVRSVTRCQHCGASCRAAPAPLRLCARGLGCGCSTEGQCARVWPTLTTAPAKRLTPLFAAFRGGGEPSFSHPTGPSGVNRRRRVSLSRGGR